LGVGLLGEALAMSQGTTYLDLLSRKVLTPIGLTDTTSDLTGSQQARFMQPFSAKGKKVAPWTFKAMAGAGCLRSSARDMEVFAAAVVKAMAQPETPLDRAICSCAAPVFGLGPRGAMEPFAQSLGWISLTMEANAPRMLFHNGGTAGSTSALYICPSAKSAALILSNRGVAANIWSNIKLRRSNPDKAMSYMFARMRSDGAQ